MEVTQLSSFDAWRVIERSTRKPRKPINRLYDTKFVVEHTPCLGLCSAIYALFRTNQISYQARVEMLDRLHKLKPKTKYARLSAFWWPLTVAGLRRRNAKVRRILRRDYGIRKF